MSSSKRRHVQTVLASVKRSKQLRSYRWLQRRLLQIRDQVVTKEVAAQLDLAKRARDHSYAREFSRMLDEVKRRVSPLLTSLKEIAERWSKPKPGSIVFFRFDIQNLPQHMHGNVLYFGKVIERAALPQGLPIDENDNTIPLILFKSWSQPSDSFATLSTPSGSMVFEVLGARQPRYGHHIFVADHIDLPCCHLTEFRYNPPNLDDLERQDLTHRIQTRQATLREQMPGLHLAQYRLLDLPLEQPPNPHDSVGKDTSSFAQELIGLRRDRMRYQVLEHKRQHRWTKTNFATVPAYCLTPDSMKPVIPAFIQETHWQDMRTCKTTLEQEFGGDVARCMFFFLYSHDVLEAAKSLAIPEAFMW